MAYISQYTYYENDGNAPVDANWGSYQYVSLKDTIAGFKGILDGDYDDMPEQAFYMVGTIEEAVEKAKNL